MKNRRVSLVPWPPAAQALPESAERISFHGYFSDFQIVLMVHFGLFFPHLLGSHPECSDACELEALRCKRLRKKEPVKIIHCKTPAKDLKSWQDRLSCKSYHVSNESSMTLAMPTNQASRAARMLTVISV